MNKTAKDNDVTEESEEAADILDQEGEEDKELEESEETEAAGPLADDEQSEEPEKESHAEDSEHKILDKDEFQEDDSGSDKPQTDEYFLEVVKDGEQPSWPGNESEYIIGSQPLLGDLVQYWAYPKESGKSEHDLPPAEIAARDNLTPQPAILIDQTDDLLDLIIVKDGHALAKTESSVANLEENITSSLEFAKNKFNIKVEHFMTTPSVSDEVEKTLDDLEKGGMEYEPKEEHPADIIRDSGEHLPAPEEGDFSIHQVNRPTQPAGIYTQAGRSGGSKKKTWVLILVLIILIGGLGVIFRDKLMRKLGLSESQTASSPSPSVAPVASPSATPIPITRSKYTVNVLNGTTKTGAAKTLSDKLKTLGYQIGTVGNASNSATPQTTVQVKNAQSDLANTLITDLAPDYLASRAADLAPSAKQDADVIIGLK